MVCRHINRMQQVFMKKHGTLYLRSSREKRLRLFSCYGPIDATVSFNAPYNGQQLLSVIGGTECAVNPLEVMIHACFDDIRCLAMTAPTTSDAMTVKTSIVSAAVKTGEPGLPALSPITVYGIIIGRSPSTEPERKRP